jgi:hypothetical protein
MTNYQDWNGSRWEYMKSQSKWHFDNMRDPEHGKDSYTFVGNFHFYFKNVIEKYIPVAQASTWATRNNFNPKIAQEGLYSASAEQQDLIRAGADPNQEIFLRAAADDEPVFKYIAEYLGIENPAIKFHNQKTGQMLHLHIDNFAARPERDNSFKNTEMDENPDIMRRFAIMLDDWKPGQIFQLGNAMYWQWLAGDCITWEWKDIPHCTANMGWDDRPMLQITGYTTTKTNELLNKARDLGPFYHVISPLSFK